MVDVQAVVGRGEEVKRLTERRGDVRRRIEAYRGLPADREQAVEEVRKLEGQVGELKRRLNELFRDMVEKG